MGVVSAKLADWCQRMVDQLVAAIDANPGQWVRPWTLMGTPCNALTGKPYRGSNWLFLSMTGHSTPWYATYKQWQSVDAQVRKGEHGMPLVWWGTQTKRTDDNGEETEFTRRVANFFTVFHHSQVDGWDAPDTPTFDHTLADRFTEWESPIPVDIVHGGDRAYYSPLFDQVCVPNLEQFATVEAYYGTVAHELAHWTGHTSRLNRLDMTSRYGDDSYAIEELIAETSAAMTCALLGLSSVDRPDHAQYLAGWVRVLREQPTALIAVASKAQMATDYLMAFSEPIEQEHAA